MLQMLRLVKVRDTKRVFFTDEKNFYLYPLISNQNSRVWSIAKKADVRPDRLIVEREKFAPHVMVSVLAFWWQMSTTFLLMKRQK